MGLIIFKSETYPVKKEPWFGNGIIIIRIIRQAAPTWRRQFVPRERETEPERETHTQRERERQRDRETERDREREKGVRGLAASSVCQ